MKLCTLENGKIHISEELKNVDFLMSCDILCFDHFG
jgi:hypothetical protein